MRHGSVHLQSADLFKKDQFSRHSMPGAGGDRWSRLDCACLQRTDEVFGLVDTS